MRHICQALVACLVLTTTCVSWADVADGIKALQSGDYEGALKTLLPLAEAGDHQAEYLVGNMYQTGQGVQVWYAQAAKWFARSANADYPPAQLALGQLGLAGFYSMKIGVSMNPIGAARLIRRAANRQYARAQAQLGALYLSGELFDKDPVLSYMWFSLALRSAQPGDPVEQMQADRDRVERLLTANQLAKARQLTESWQAESGSQDGPGSDTTGRQLGQEPSPASGEATPRQLQEEALAAQRRMQEEQLAQQRRLQEEALAAQRQLQEEQLAEQRRLSNDQFWDNLIQQSIQNAMPPPARPTQRPTQTICQRSGSRVYCYSY